jgi:uncharacterized protein (DUF302 family)
MAAEGPLSVRLPVGYEQAVGMVKAALKEQGFGVLSEIDVKRTLKEKIGADFRKYNILGACNPSIAFAGLQKELNLGLFLPCNVIVYELDGGSMVTIQDPAVMVDVVGNPDLKDVADIARQHLERVVESLRAKT